MVARSRGKGAEEAARRKGEDAAFADRRFHHIQSQQIFEAIAAMRAESARQRRAGRSPRLGQRVDGR